MIDINNLKFLITGGSGFIGKSLVIKLLEIGSKVIIYDKQTPKLSHDIKDLEYISGSVYNDKDLSKLKNIDFNVIFHLASNANIPHSVANPKDDFLINALGTMKMLELARKKDIKKFIYPSTVSVFDVNKIPLSENDKVKVSSPYGASKLTGESYCYAYNRTYGLNTNVIRLFNVYGPGMNKYLIYDIVCKLRENTDKIVIYGDGTQIRDYLYIDDLINAFLLILEKGIPGEDYNVSRGIPTKIIDLVNLIADIMNIKNLKIELTNKSWDGDIKKWYADISKIKKLGFEPKTSLNEGLKKTIKEILRNG